MIEFIDVSERIRSILQKKLDKRKIYDRDIASALSLDPQYFAVIKKRNKIPYESIASFCKQHNISMNWILLAQEPAYLT